MKKLFPLILSAFLIFQLFSAHGQCFPDGIMFTSQLQIDIFPTEYPGCTEIEGEVAIFGDDITNLEGLNSVTSIGETLLIINNHNLTSLTGLENLAFIGGNLEIEDNNALASLSGLQGLTSVAGTVQIRYNDVLSSLAALSNLTSVGGNLWLWDNAMSDMTGLENLTSIGGYLGILQNSELTSLSGLDNINAGSISGLDIINNPLLSTCDVKSICDFLIIPGVEYEIYGNSYGCHNSAEILEFCASGISDFNTSSNRLSIYPNPSDIDIITISLENTATGLHLACFNIFGQEVHQQEITGNESVISISTWNPGIYLLVLYQHNRIIGNTKFVVK